MKTETQVEASEGFLDKAAAAEFVGVSQCLLDIQRRRKKLSAFKIGAKVLFRRADLCRWVLEHREERS